MRERSRDADGRQRTNVPSTKAPTEEQQKDNQPTEMRATAQRRLTGVQTRNPRRPGLQSLPGPAGRRPPPAARRPGFYEEELKLHRKLQQELSKHPTTTNQGPPPRGHLGFGGDRAESKLGHQDAKRGAVARGALSSLLSAACLTGLLGSRTVPGPPPKTSPYCSKTCTT